MSGWQPIETAPRDGTRIAVKDMYGNEREAVWDGGWRDPRRFWFMRGASQTWLRQPSSWMLLPSRPQPKGRQ